MVEVREVLRLWLRGYGYRRIADRLGADRKTVRRYVEAGQGVGLERSGGEEQLTDERLGAMAAQLQSGRPPRLYGEAWQELEKERETLAKQLEAGLRLTKVHGLLARRGVLVPYRTLHRFCASELEFGRPKKTVRVRIPPGTRQHLRVAKLRCCPNTLSGRPARPGAASGP